ncbi:PfkB family carbohydrate kinase [Mycetocola miduiensis]|uniref:Ribokinase n=1 Tax=Mycetocola miduiensis TaxID=995034 RepID=A0A1I4YB73_9MICO|nr:PfkB family carbohydrate kinase [Mycetocola miduiensis]SFN34829.1 ribokinase [Mycetocola miduiensis]
MKHPNDGVAVDVLTIGSIHLDHQFSVDALPGPGETVLALSAQRGLGGKGANQAAAASRAGARSAFFGFVGDDPQSADILQRLHGLGVDVSAVVTVQGAESGSAIVVRDAKGENQIVVNSGAGAEGRVTDASLADQISKARVLVVQGELPSVLSVRAARLAHELNVRLVINLAPVASFDGVLQWADPLVVNEVEAAQLVGGDARHTDETLVLRLGDLAKTVVVTLGARGAIYLENGSVRRVPARVARQVVDTTGAGDAFVGSLAAALARGAALGQAVGVAVVAASLSVENLGAAETYPMFEAGS